MALDEAFYDTLLLKWPLPVADAGEALAAAVEPHEVRDRVVEVFRALLRLAAGYALAARVQYGSGGEANDRVGTLVALLRRRSLTDGQWVELTRELLRPWKKKRDQHALPELVELFHGNRAFPALLDGFLAMRKNETVAHGGTGERDELEALLAKRLPQLAKLVACMEPALTRHVLVVGRGEGEGLRLIGPTPNRGRWRRHPANTPAGRLALVDAEGNGRLDLHPIALFMPAMPEGLPEVFFLDGASRRGVKYLGIPSMARREEGTGLDVLEDLLGASDTDGGGAEQAPFVGLASFGPGDVDRFFGREREADDLANRVRRFGLVAVTGASGSGKTSLVHAGVLPKLADHITVSIRPGLAPMQALQAALSDVLGFDVEDARDAVRYCRAHEERLLVVADQAEEILTLAPNPEARDAWLEAMAQLGGDDAGPTRVLLVVREDFFARLSRGALAGTIERHLVVVTKPQREAMLRTLYGPVMALGFQFDEGLPERMVDVVGDEPSALALLQFCAAELWEARDRSWKRLTTEAYEQIGGVEGALAQHAEKTIEGLRTAQVEHAKRVFSRLVTPERTRAVIPLERAGRGPEERAVVDALVAARLVVGREGTDGEALVEVVHEALISHWPRLDGWLSEDEEGHRHLAALSRAAEQWEAGARSKDLLWRGDPLAQVTIWQRRAEPSLDAREQAFLDASLAAESRWARRRRWAVGGFIALLATGLAVTVGLAATAVSYSFEATAAAHDAELSAKRAKAALVASRAVSWESRDTVVTALLLGEVDLSADPAVTAVLKRVHGQLLPREIRPLQRFPGDWDAQLFPGVFAGVDGEGATELIDLADQRTLRIEPVPGKRQVPIYVRPDMELAVLVWSTEEAIFHYQVWRPGESLQPLGGAEPFEGSVRPAFDALGRFFANVRKTEVGVWDLQTATNVWSTKQPLTHVLFTHGGEFLVGRAEGGLVTFATADGSPGPSIELAEPIGFAQARPHTRDVLVATTGGNVWLVTVGSDPPKLIAQHPGGAFDRGGFSDDGRVVALADGAGTVMTVDIQTLETAVSDYGEPVMPVLSADGAWMVVATAGMLNFTSLDGAWPDREVKIGRELPLSMHLDDSGVYVLFAEGLHVFDVPSAWDLATNDVDAASGPSVFQMPGRLRRARWNKDGSRVVLAGAELHIVDTTTGQARQLATTDAMLWTGGFSDDGGYASSTAMEGTVIWDVERGEEVVVLQKSDERGWPMYLFPRPNSTEFVAGWQLGHVTVHGVDGTSRELTASGAGQPNYIEFSDDGRRVMVASTEGNAWVYDFVSEATKLHSFDGGMAMFSRDGERVSHAGPDGIRVGPALGDGAFEFLDAERAYYRSRFSPDGHHLAASTEDGQVVLFDLVGDEAPKSAPFGSRATLRWSPDSTTLVVRSNGQDPAVWLVDKDRRFSLLGHEARTNWVEFAEDGRLLSVSDDGTARIWALDVYELQDTLRERIAGCLSIEFRTTQLAESREEAMATWSACQERLGRDPEFLLGSQ